MIKSEIFWTVIGLIVTITIFLIPYINSITNEENEKAEKTKIALCNLQEIIFRQSASRDASQLREELASSIVELQKIDLKQIDEDVQDFILKVRSFYNNIRFTVDRKDSSENQGTLLRIEIEKFNALLSGFKKLQSKILVKYNIKTNC